jgi:hypothetical protein
MQSLGSVESTVRIGLKGLPWPSIVATLLTAVTCLALILLLVLASLRCADTYELITMTKWPACVAPHSIGEVTTNVRCTGTPY